MVLRAFWSPLGLLLGALGGNLGALLVPVGPILSSKNDLPSFENLVFVFLFFFFFFFFFLFFVFFFFLSSLHLGEAPRGAVVNLRAAVV